jgi:hypothetical protein
LITASLRDSSERQGQKLALPNLVRIAISCALGLASKCITYCYPCGQIEGQDFYVLQMNPVTELTP